MRRVAPSARRRRADRDGRRAETLAAWWLRLRGWRIVARRLRTSAIEIDLVARRGAVIALVEVKRRATIDAALTALTPHALARLRRAAANVGPGLARDQRMADATIRVDLIAMAPFSRPRHVANIGA